MKNIFLAPRFLQHDYQPTTLVNTPHFCARPERGWFLCALWDPWDDPWSLRRGRLPEDLCLTLLLLLFFFILLPRRVFFFIVFCFYFRKPWTALVKRIVKSVLVKCSEHIERGTTEPLWAKEFLKFSALFLDFFCFLLF